MQRGKLPWGDVLVIRRKRIKDIPQNYDCNHAIGIHYKPDEPHKSQFIQ